MVNLVLVAPQEGRACARTGAEAAPLEEAAIRDLASAAHHGDAPVASARLLTEAPIEWRNYTPVWQVEFDDNAATRLYMNPVTGDVETVRTRLWRIYDVAWMLHIMDYEERENFNNPLLITASVFALVTVVAGLLLLVLRLQRLIRMELARRQ